MAQIVAEIAVEEDDPPAPRGWSLAIGLDNALLRVVVFLLDRIWGVILRFWSAVIVGAIVVSTVVAVIEGKQTWQNALASPTRWPIIQLLALHIWLAALIVAGGAIFTWLCYRAHGARQHYEARMKLCNDFIARPIRLLSPRSVQLTHYYATLSLKRADAQAPGRNAKNVARAALRACATRRPTASQGVYIRGRSMQGKTHLAWDAMRAELPGWTLVRWPLSASASAQFDVRLFHGQRVALWLDDVDRYAKDDLAQTVCGLPQRFAEAGVPLAIVATCRDGRREEQARLFLGPLLDTLQVVSPADITEPQARDLARGLAVLSHEREKDEQFYFDLWDEQTPGSILLGLDYMLRTVASTLSDEARFILWALQALYWAYSRRARSFSVARVRIVCDALFHWPRADDAGFAGALVELMESHYITLPRSLVSFDDASASAPLRADGEGGINIPEPYLERGIPEYPNWHGEIMRAWPAMRDALVVARDGAALLNLGEACFGAAAHNGKTQADPYALRRLAEACYRPARSLYAEHREQTAIEWVTATHNLAATLHALTHWLPEDEPDPIAKKKALLTEARQLAEEAKDFCRERYFATGLKEWSARAQLARETEDAIWFALGALS